MVFLDTTKVNFALHFKIIARAVVSMEIKFQLLLNSRG